jgi:membrane AbrB-like protein
VHDLSSSEARRDVRRVAETLLIAAAGGCTLGFLGFPAGWLSGAIVAVSVAALAGRPMKLPEPLARITYVVMGISLGGAVSPETVAGMAIWPLSLAILAIGMLVLTATVTWYLRAVHGWDKGSALLASFPGGLATVLVLAVQNGADVRAVAIVQTVRVAALAVLLPSALAAFGFAGAPITTTAHSALSDPGGLSVLIIVSGAAALVAHRLRFPGGLIFGAMISSAILHGSGLVSVGLPAPVAIASFVVLGGLTGTRFANTDARMLRHLGGAAFGAFMVGNAVALLFALGSAWLLSLSYGGAVLAYAPGAIDAMMILALALHLDPAFVGAHHLARFMLVLLTMPMLVRFVQRAKPAAIPVQASSASGSAVSNLHAQDDQHQSQGDDVSDDERRTTQHEPVGKPERDTETKH